MNYTLRKIVHDRMLCKQADKATTVKDYVGAGISPALLGPLGAPVSAGGHLIGTFDTPEGYDYFKNRAKQDLGVLGIAPGLGAYHWDRRLVNTTKAYGDDSPRTRKVVRELSMIPSLVSTLGLADLIGVIAAASTKRRTDEEQQQASTASKWKYLIPGYATYDYWKTMGKSEDLQEKANKEVEEGKNNQGTKKEDTASKQASFIQGYVDNVKENPLTHIGAATGVILSLLTSKGTVSERAVDAGLSGASGALMGFAGDTVMDARKGINELRDKNKKTVTINIPKLK